MALASLVQQGTDAVPDGASLSPRAHVLVGIVTVGTLAFILRLVRRRQLRSKYAMLWISIGLGLGVLAAFPGVLVPVSDAVGISYPPATFMLAAIAFLLVLVVHFSWELSRLEDRSRILAEELAMVKAETRALQQAFDASAAPKIDDA